MYCIIVRGTAQVTVKYCVPKVLGHAASSGDWVGTPGSGRCRYCIGAPLGEALGLAQGSVLEEEFGTLLGEPLGPALGPALGPVLPELGDALGEVLGAPLRIVLGAVLAFVLGTVLGLALGPAVGLEDAQRCRRHHFAGVTASSRVTLNSDPGHR